MSALIRVLVECPPLGAFLLYVFGVGVGVVVYGWWLGRCPGGEG